MMKAKKGNRVVRIPDEKIEEYKKLGYTITDMDGNMVYEHVDPAQKLKAAEEKVAALEKENAELRAEIERLKGAESQEAEEKPAADAEAGTEKTGKGKTAKSGK